MKSSVFLHVFNDISTYVYVFMEYFLHSFSNLSIESVPCSAMKYYYAITYRLHTHTHARTLPGQNREPLSFNFKLVVYCTRMIKN